MIQDANRTVADLLYEKNLLPHLILEDYLLVKLDLRKCALLTFPAELPDSDVISRRIDEKCVSELYLLRQERETRKRREMIENVRNHLRIAYLEEVKSSLCFQSHQAWIKRLDLESFEVEVRPTVRELFIFANNETRTQVQELARKRKALRESFLKRANRFTPPSIVAYPEELFPEYVRELGGVLGYPECCIEAYAEGRSRGNYTVEQRSFDQIAALKRQGIQPDPYAFFSKGFIPCRPTCAKASAVGRRIHEVLSALDGRLTSLHIECLERNVATVSSYVARAKAHDHLMKKRLEELGY